MRTVTVVNREEVLKLYNGDWRGYYSLADGGSYNLSNVNVDDHQVTWLNNIGPYSVIQSNHVASVNLKFIVPTELLKTIEIPYAIDIYKPILNQYYLNRWVYMNGNVYIHYPTLEIKNSLGQTHTIHDLVIRFSLQNDTVICGLQGMRYSWTPEELSNYYSHSHLNIRIEKFQDFCLGGGSNFKTFFDNLQKVNSTEEFELFLIQLESYLSWESLEGTPYISISKLTGFETISGTIILDRTTIEYQTAFNDYCKDVVLQLHRIPNTLLQFNPTYVFDPSFDSAAFYEIEKELLLKYKDTALKNELLSWDENAYVYITTNEGSSFDLPDFEDIIHVELVNKFNIEAKVLPSKRVSADLGKRFSTNFIENVVKQVNVYLLNGLKTIKINEQGNSLTTQSESNSNERVATANTLATCNMS